MQNQTLKVLSTLTSHTVQHLLMGGQACVLYGAVPFSRDADVAILASADNIDRLRQALDELHAEVIAVPPFESQFLDRGLAIHFRCRHLDLSNFRLDVMSVMRGVDPFPELWQRRSTIRWPDGQAVDVMNIADLVKAKKTQRDKDWPMIAALLESHYRSYRDEATPELIDFWLSEGRIPETLIDISNQYKSQAESTVSKRPLVQFAIHGDLTQLRRSLLDEQQREQEIDRAYWKPLMAELERLRHDRRRHR
jgi:hypothetical protein